MLLFLLTLLFAIVISGPVNYLAQMGLPRGLGVFVVLVSLALALWLASRVIIPVIEVQASQFVREFPALLTQVQDLVWSSQSAFGVESGTSMDSESLFETGRDYLSVHASSAVSVGRGLVEACFFGRGGIHHDHLSRYTACPTSERVSLVFSGRT